MSAGTRMVRMPDGEMLFGESVSPRCPMCGEETMNGDDSRWCNDCGVLVAEDGRRMTIVKPREGGWWKEVPEGALYVVEAWSFEEVP